MNRRGERVSNYRQTLATFIDWADTSTSNGFHTSLAGAVGQSQATRASRALQETSNNVQRDPRIAPSAERKGALDQDNSTMPSTSSSERSRGVKRLVPSGSDDETESDQSRLRVQEPNNHGSARRRRRDSPLPATSGLPLVLPADIDNGMQLSSSQEGDSGNGSENEHQNDADESEERTPAASSEQQSTVESISRRRDKDGYSPGEIVRVKLTNFVTYDFVEFHPGPHLNMIVGPNGTGKSTIVCAIALGLGYKPSVLGRAKEVSSYVKEGRASGSIEIELKGQFPAQANPVIQRIIHVEDNSSEWRLGASKASAKEIAAVVDKLGIEIGNLCCFLPQDKVADFAKMGPSELLRETQKAAGRQHMNDWHERLIELGKEQRELAGKLAARNDEVLNLQERMDVLSRDVQRAEERRRIEVKLGALDALLAETEYRAMKTKWEDAKKQKEIQSAKLGQLKEKLKPIRDRLISLERGAEQAALELKGAKQAARKEDDVCGKSCTQLDKIEEEAENLQDQLDSVKKMEQSRRAAIVQLRKDIESLEDAVKNEPPKPDTRQIDGKTREIREQERALGNEESEGKAEQEEMSAEIKSMDRKTDQIRQRLLEIDNVKNARLQMLQKVDKHTYEAVMWLRQNAGIFSQKVFEPVMLEISVRDPNMASAVEGCVNFAAQKTFVCQTEEDYDLFGRTVLDKMHLRVNFVHRQHARTLHELTAPANERELQSLGFDGYVLDLIEGPTPVLQYLCTDFHLESVPFARNEASVDSTVVENAGKFLRYITGRNLHTLNRSQYGSRAWQTMTRTLRGARTFSQSVDQTLRRSLDDEIQSINTRKRQLEARGRELSAQTGARRQKAEELRAQRNALEQQKGDLLKRRGMWEKDGHRLAAKRNALKEQEERPSAAQEREDLMSHIVNMNVKAQKVVDEVHGMLQRQIEFRHKADTLDLQGLERKAKVLALSQLKERQEGQFQEAEQRLDEIKIVIIRLKKEAYAMLGQAKSKLEDAEQEVMNEFNELRELDLPLDQVQNRYNEERANLNLAMSVQPGVVDEYNRRRKEVEALQTKLTQIQREKRRLDEQVSKLYGMWKSALDELIGSVSERFSKAFEAIGNAGQVRLAEVGDDYEKWGIEILVKFRNEGHMQLLTGQWQSGGERSIATITYLLSLTQMSRSPFSLVDEINQGMDQKYERQVHDHMVQVTCAELAGQYFLITPKLLPDLCYHERMRVLIINNGEWLPEKLNFWHYIRSKKEKKKQGAAHGAFGRTGPSRPAIAASS